MDEFVFIITALGRFVKNLTAVFTKNPHPAGNIYSYFTNPPGSYDKIGAGSDASLRAAADMKRRFFMSFKIAFIGAGSVVPGT